MFPDKNIVRHGKYGTHSARRHDKTVKNMQLREIPAAICLIRAEKHCLPNMYPFMKRVHMHLRETRAPARQIGHHSMGD